MSDEARVPLIDRFMESTYHLAKGMKPAAVRDVVASQLIRYRPLLKNANRFFLDDDFVEMATRLSSSITMGDIRKRIPLATLPYETTWIEFNLHRKMETIFALRGELDRKPDDLTPEYLGLLLQRDPLRPTAWAMTVVATPRGADAETSPMPAVYLMDVLPDRHHHSLATAGFLPFHLTVLDYALGKDKENFRLGHDFTFGMNDKFDQPESGSTEFRLTRGLRSMPWGLYSKSPSAKSRFAAIEEIGALTPEEVLQHTQLGIAPIYATVLKYHQKMNYETGVSKWLREYVTDLMENTGILRFAVTVLAMLNDVPYKIRPTQHYGQRRLGLTHKPYMEYHTVTLQLPKTRPIAYVKRLLNQAESQKNRAHMVRQHWRTYLDHDRHWCKPDEHEWIYDHANGYRLCSKCEAEGRRIDEHPRGDPNLGWVQKEYKLTPAQEMLRSKHEAKWKKSQSTLS